MKLNRVAAQELNYSLRKEGASALISQEQWQEIKEARARLQAYRDKIETYPSATLRTSPSYPEENIPPETCSEQSRTIKPIFRPRPVDKEIDQLKLGYLDLQKKFNKHTDLARAKSKAKRDGF